MLIYPAVLGDAAIGPALYGWEPALWNGMDVNDPLRYGLGGSNPL